MGNGYDFEVFKIFDGLNEFDKVEIFSIDDLDYWLLLSVSMWFPG